VTTHIERQHLLAFAHEVRVRHVQPHRRRRHLITQMLANLPSTRIAPRVRIICPHTHTHKHREVSCCPAPRSGAQAERAVHLSGGRL
jgi:hypothetical protein